MLYARSRPWEDWSTDFRASALAIVCRLFRDEENLGGARVKIPVSLNVNGTSYAVLVEPEQSLADTLRVDLGLAGTKRACNEGECGSCTVLLDGAAINSCLTLAVQVQDRAITTIEGLAPAGELHPVQRAFVEHHAAQCGYCTPGMILTAASLLAANPSPSEED